MLSRGLFVAGLSLLLAAAQIHETTHVVSTSYAKERERDKDSRAFYGFVVKDAQGADVPLSTYASAKVVLLVNVATECYFAYDHFKELVVLYDKYRDKGLEILAFPCNDFGQKEPGSDEQIQASVAQYGVAFPVFAKLHVIGDDMHPLFLYLRYIFFRMAAWNFSKVLVVDGVPEEMHGYAVTPLKLEEKIARLLGLNPHSSREL